MAHDFNNILSVISNHSNVLLEELDSDSKLRKDVVHIRDAGHRAIDLTRQLMLFGRRNSNDPEVLRLNDIISDTNKLLKRVIGDHIALRYESGTALSNIKADRRQLEQVLLNLAVNARDAMPGGGTLRIKTDKENIEDPLLAKSLSLSTGTYAKIIVEDDGFGMSPDIQARIFEPFYSTKPLGEGTGLGLSTSIGIIQKNNGTILVESDPGRGSKFTILLPATDEEPKPEPTQEQTESPTLEKLTILLVEDDDSVRFATQRILKRLGFNVLSARNGDEAIQISMTRPNQIQVLLTDVVMPGMSGVDLAQRITKTRKDIGVVYMSGYPDEHLDRHFGKERNAILVQKPFDHIALLNALNNSLSKST